MFQAIRPVVLCAFLAACGDPLAGLDRLRDLNVADGEPTPAALPSEDEIAREGFFGTPAAEAGDAALSAPVPEVEPAPRRGLWALLRPTGEADAQADAVAAAVAQSESIEAAQQIPEAVAAKSETPVPEVVVTPAPARAGFFGRLLGNGSNSAATDVATPEDDSDPTSAEDVQLAALSPTPGVSQPPAAGRGFFGRKARLSDPAKPRTGPDARDVEYGTILPFGEIARSCVSRGRPLGRKVDRAPANGYTLFDTKPDTAEPRTFYITGFNDGCPRQLTAANVLLGSASRYEGLYYGPGSEHLPRGETDKAYAKVKRQVCGVTRNAPCGAKIAKMDRATFFVTAYSRFGNANTWSELLIHDGEVLAAAIKSYK